MPIETATYINDLAPSNPLGSDPAGQGDDHLRLIKSVLAATFPNMGGVLGTIRKLDTPQTISAIFNTDMVMTSASFTASVVLTLPAAASVTSGWFVQVATGTNYTILTPQASASINGAATFTLPPNTMGLLAFDSGTAFRAWKWPLSSAAPAVFENGLTLGAGIKFPATQVLSADPNTLDDYEEGTWTPTLSATTVGNLVIVYGSRIGNYTKIGRQVTIELYLNMTTFTHTTAAGNFFVGGLPFTSGNADNYGTARFDFWGINFVGAGPPAIAVYGAPIAWIQAADARIFFYLSGVATIAGATVGTANHTTGTASILGASITYTTS